MSASTLTPLQKGITLVALILPAVSILMAQLVWKPTEDDAQCVRWRPASEVSIFAWVVIALTSGLAWAMTNMQYFGGKMESNVSFATLSMLFVVVFSLLIVHQSVYQHDIADEDTTGMLPKKEAMGIFVVLMLFLAPLVLMCYKCKPMCAALLAPLFFWIVYQMLLGAAELNCQVPVVCKDSITSEQEEKVTDYPKLITQVENLEKEKTKLTGEQTKLTTEQTKLTTELTKITARRGKGSYDAITGIIEFKDTNGDITARMLTNGHLVTLAESTAESGEVQLYHILDAKGKAKKDSDDKKITYNKDGVVVPTVDQAGAVRALAVFGDQQNAMPDFGF